MKFALALAVLVQAVRANYFFRQSPKTGPTHP